MGKLSCPLLILLLVIAFFATNPIGYATPSQTANSNNFNN